VLNGHNTLKRHLYVMELNNNPTCTEEETSVHILCECEALASLRHAHLGSFFLDPEDIRKLSAGPSGTLAKEVIMGHRGPVLRPRCIGPGRGRTQIPFIHSLDNVITGDNCGK
jgi:hypothetical protein